MTAASEQGGDTPVETFSSCHVGIVTTMHELAELPALLEPVRRFQEISMKAESFFSKVVVVHHREEEEELFTSVLSSALAGSERTQVQEMVSRLTKEHRVIEAGFARLLPAIRAARKDSSHELNAREVNDLVKLYLSHAQFEEAVFLPLAKSILGRNGDHLAALGMSLHIRHASSAVRRNFGSI